MPESTPDTESTPSPYISLEEDQVNVNRLKPDVAHQLYNDIRRKAKRQDLKIKRKNRALEDLFDTTSADDLPDYQAAQIVDAEEKATLDPLTGLLNRRAFETQVKEKLSQGAAGLVLMIDADFFKEVNDTYGHPTGDQVLQRTAFALKSNVELTKDIIGRYGGEEFVAFIQISNPDFEKDKIFAIAERIRRNIIDYLKNIRYETSQDGKAVENFIPVTISLGATITYGDPWEEALKRADENLYKAKKGGRNQSFGDSGKIIPVSLPGAPPETAAS